MKKHSLHFTFLPYLRPLMEVFAIAFFCLSMDLKAEVQRFPISGKQAEISLDALESPLVLSLFLSDGNLFIMGNDASKMKVVLEAFDDDDVGYLILDTQTGNAQLQLAGDQKESDLQFTLPKNTSLQIRLSDGNASIQQISGSIDITSSDGNILLKQVEGSVSASTSDGNITLETGSVAYSKNITLSASDGDIDLTLPKDAAFLLSARSADGEIVCTYPFKPSNIESQISLPEGRRNRPVFSDRFEFEAGSDGFPILLSTVDGNINISQY